MAIEKFKPVTRTLGGHVVEVTPLPARHALTYKFKLLQLLGGPLVDLVRGPIAGLLKNVDVIKAVVAKSTPGVGNLDIDLSTLSAAMFDTLDPEKSTQLIFDFCASARLDGRELTETVINEVFSGDLTMLYKVFFFALEVNYRDFLGVLGTTKTVAPPVSNVKK
jgi:hypothetical protein